MDKRIKWTSDYDFAMLSMMQVFSDEELMSLGMMLNDIARFREYERKYPSSIDSEKQNIQDAELFEGDNNTMENIDITKIRETKVDLPNNNWSEGIVDREDDHIKLFFLEQESPIALVHQTEGKDIVVQFLTKIPEDQIAKEEAIRDLDFFFNELTNPDPWGYAIHHCNTASNLFSHVHWGYFPVGWEPR